MRVPRSSVFLSVSKRKAPSPTLIDAEDADDEALANGFVLDGVNGFLMTTEGLLVELHCNSTAEQQEIASLTTVEDATPEEEREGLNIIVMKKKRSKTMVLRLTTNGHTIT